MLVADQCEDVEYFDLSDDFHRSAKETIRKARGDVECPDMTGETFCVFFVSDGSHLRLDAGDYLVRRTAPDARAWEVWTGEDFKVEFFGVENSPS